MGFFGDLWNDLTGESPGRTRSKPKGVGPYYAVGYERDEPGGPWKWKQVYGPFATKAEAQKRVVELHKGGYRGATGRAGVTKSRPR